MHHLFWKDLVTSFRRIREPKWGRRSYCCAFKGCPLALSWIDRLGVDVSTSASYSGDRRFYFGGQEDCLVLAKIEHRDIALNWGAHPSNLSFISFPNNLMQLGRRRACTKNQTSDLQKCVITWPLLQYKSAPPVGRREASLYAEMLSVFG
jgi:hypothetical protein